MGLKAVEWENAIPVAEKAGTATGKRLMKSIQPYLLVLPGFLFVLCFTLYPIASVVVHGFLRENLAHPEPDWAGWDNYVRLWQDPLFHQVLKNTGLYVVMVVPAAVCLGFLFAVWMNGYRRIGAFLRTAFLYPVILPVVSVASIWLFILTPEYGLLSHVTRWAGLPEQALLRDANTALAALAAVGIWRQAGFYALFFLAGLQGVDPDVEHAARVDGAGRWAVIRYVRIPIMWPVVVFVLTLAVLNALQTMDVLYVMTQGGPDNATNLILYHMYETQFAFGDTGLASAISVFFLAAVGLVSAVQVFVADRRRRDSDG